MMKVHGGKEAIHSPAVVSHQNVRLEAGRHFSPERGACVVELASMLAGEDFSDHPRSVCPVIAAYMRAVNDAIDDGGRQWLYPYAAAIVDTRGDWRTRRARRRACLSWSRHMGTLSALQARWAALRGETEMTARLCARTALEVGGRSLALALADALIELGAEEARDADASQVASPAPLAA